MNRVFASGKLRYKDNVEDIYGVLVGEKFLDEKGIEYINELPTETKHGAIRLLAQTVDYMSSWDNDTFTIKQLKTAALIAEISRDI